MITLIFPGCPTYGPQFAPCKLPKAYANVQRVSDTSVGVRAWANDVGARGLLRRICG